MKGNLFMKRLLALSLLLLLLLVSLAGCSSNEETNNPETGLVLNIYSSRHYDVDFDLADAFYAQTGITINMIQGNSNELLERAIRESDNPQADLFINVGAVTMYTALEEGILEPLHSSFVSETVREGLYGDYWTALATRARVIVYDNESDDYISISRYSDLADPQFADSILVRSSTNIYNISLVAALLQVEGEEEATLFAEGMANNLARDPQGNDRDQMRAIVAGEGRYGITNNYYLQMLLMGSDQTDVMVGQRMAFMFPDEVFEDISWVGITNGAPNRENALRFIEFLLEAEQQQVLMELNGEAPANRHVQIIPSLAPQYAFTPMPVNFETLGRYTTRASILMDLAGWQ